MNITFWTLFLTIFSRRVQDQKFMSLWTFLGGKAEEFLTTHEMCEAVIKPVQLQKMDMSLSGK